MNITLFILLLLLSYLVGAIPFGLIYGLIRGVDIRKIGSGNIGATNVKRAFGFWGGFVPVFILDFCKGALPVLIVYLNGVEGLDKDIAMILTGLMAILGHTFPVYLKFKGGKGVATSAGVISVLAPFLFLFSFGTFLSIVLITKLLEKITKNENIVKKQNVGLGSVISSILSPFACYFIYPQRYIVLIIITLICILIVIRHKSNIKALISK